MPLSIRQSMGRNNRPSASWLMFANPKNPTSLRLVLGMRLAESDPVVIAEPSISVLRTHSIPSMRRRSWPIVRTKAGWRYRPLHFPERVPGLSSSVRSLNRLLFRRELSRLIPEGTMRIACYDSPGQRSITSRAETPGRCSGVTRGWGQRFRCG